MRTSSIAGSDMESQMTNSTPGRYNFALAAVIVLLSVAVAVSGWLIVSALEKVEGKDPFEASHTYDVSGSITVDAVSYDCTGSASSESISETTTFTVVQISVNYQCSLKNGHVLAEIMFDSDRNPTSQFTHVGDEDELSVWSTVVDDRTFLFFLNEKSVVEKLHVDSAELHLVAEISS